MKYQTRNILLLKKILWADCLLGGGTAIIGLLWCRWLAVVLGLPVNVIVVIAGVTLAYALTALSLAVQSRPAVGRLRILIYANWLWTAVSVGLLIYWIRGTTLLGSTFLVLQVVVVGMLAYLEGRHIKDSR